ncbi:tetratricopeptide repeat protein [Acidobacteria bacterium AH-259-O06]|nr:tetratricopeptide repeat protein [Acidobacteria bacterium AH-259-O06]
MKRQLILGLVLGLVFVAVLSGYTQHSARQLLQSGLYKEDVKGDLDAAIQIYRKIIQDFPNHRSVAAKALLQMGRCYEKLGKPEAREAYERVLREFAEQAEQVAAARARLAALTQPASVTAASGMVVRRVWVGPILRYRGLSPDGRYLHFSERLGGAVGQNLFVRDLATGKTRKLTKRDQTHQTPYAAGYAAISPTSQHVAYQWNIDELRLVGIDGSGDRLLYRNEETEEIRPYAWSPDGKHLVVLTRRRDQSSQIALVSVADGSLRQLKSLNWESRSKLRLSPDGRYIAYDIGGKVDARNRDIFVLAADASREMPLVEHPVDDQLLAWTPDGKSVLFRSDRAGTPGLWVIQVADGKPQGSPRLVKNNIGQIGLGGFTPKGAFYYTLDHFTTDVYVASLDPDTGKLLSPPRRVTERFVGRSSCPDWSPDGKYLAYISWRGPEWTGRNIIVVRSVETGEEREFASEFTPRGGRATGGFLRWSPDGRFILFGSRGGFYQLDTQTGHVTRIVQLPPTAAYGRTAEWSPDGKTVFYSFRGTSPRGDHLVRRDLETGQEQLLYSVAAPERIGNARGGWLVSPNGRHLAFTHYLEKAGSVDLDNLVALVALKVISTAGGEARELLRVHKNINETVPLHGWTRDGRYLLFGRQSPLDGPRNSRETSELLWRASLEDGQAEKLGPAPSVDREPLRLHPDGRQVAFASRQRVSEVWVMENFLPELSSTQ